MTPALVILLNLLVSGRKRSEIFLVKGHIYAEAKPTRLLGMKEPEPWPKLAVTLLTVFALVTTIFLLSSTGYSFDEFIRALPLTPVAMFIQQSTVLTKNLFLEQHLSLSSEDSWENTMRYSSPRSILE